MIGAGNEKVAAEAWDLLGFTLALGLVGEGFWVWALELASLKV